MKKFLTGFLMLFFSIAAFAQTGTVRGDIYNSMTAEPVKDIKVTAKGVSESTLTDLDGNFNLDLEPGVYVITLNDSGFDKKVIEAVEVKSGEVNYLGEIFMDEAFITEDNNIVLEGLTVQADLSKNTETALLTMKRKSAIILDGISSAKMELAGDGNAVEAAKRVTGVSVEGGKYVYIRGLGDRYSKTTLNGFDIPGLDPDRNTIQMDIFPTNLLDNVMVSKNFTADQPADFTGGILNIETKDFPNKKFMSVSAGLAYTPNMHFNDDYITYDGGNTDFLGFDDGTRYIPSAAKNNNLPNPASNSPQEVAAFVKQFDGTLAPKRESSFLDYDFGFSMGDQISLKSSTNERRRQLGYVFSLTYKNKTDYYDDVFYGEYVRSGDTSVNELNLEKKQEGELGVNTTLIGVLGGLAYKTNDSKYQLNIMHLQNGEKTAGVFNAEVPSGARFGSQFQGIAYNIDYNQRSLTNISLRGNHSIDKGDWEIEWGVSPTLSVSKDPDLRRTAYELKSNTLYFNSGGAGYPSRVWRDLNEYNVASKIDVTKDYILFNEDAKIKFGLSNTYKDRDFEVLSYVMNMPIDQDAYNWTGDPNELFLDKNLNTGRLYYTSANPDPNPNEYQANSNNFAAYISNEFRFFEKLKAIIGVRVEQFNMNHTGRDQQYQNVLDNEEVLNSLDFFPTANFIYELQDKMNLRASYSKTIARPSFKELSFAQILDPISQRTFNGGLFPMDNWDGDLTESRIDNIDLRWEYFLHAGQMFSVSGFYKFFDNPIELVLSSSSNQLQYQPRNVGDGTVIGAEFEFRKNLDFMSTSLENFSFNANVTYVKSEIEMSEMEYQSRLSSVRDGEKIDDTRDMAGQAPYVINAGLSYNSNDNGLDIGLFYNVKGETLAYVGDGSRPDIYTSPFHNLNFGFVKKFGNSVFDFKVDNILGEKREDVYQSYEAEDQLYESRSPGTSISIGYKYNF